MSISRRTFLGVAGVAALAAPLEAKARRFTLEPGPNGQVLKDPSGKIVLAYLTSKPEGLTANSACCVHPFTTLAGETTTAMAPSNHKDHRGIYFAWRNMEFKKGNDVIKADFWGGSVDRVIVNRDVRLIRSNKHMAELAVDNDWAIAGQPAMKEATTLVVGEEQGARVLDLTYRFSSDYDITLNKMAYTGFVYTCRDEGPNVFFDSQGEVTLPTSNPGKPESDWPARPWYGDQVTFPNGKVLSSAVIDHADNPPSLWHGNRDVAWLQPCIEALNPVEIPAGKPLVLRYRAVAYDGKMPGAMLDRMASVWRSKA
jgi:hypothetical protein